MALDTLAAWELAVPRRVRAGFLEEGCLNWALNHVENFSRLRRKGMVIWGGGTVYAKVRSTWEVATGPKGVDASKEGELLF